MIAHVSMLSLFSATWLATLWLLLAPAFVAWSIPQLVVLHLAPPLALWGSWLVWRRRLRERAALALAEREATAEAERQAKLDEARARHERELQHLHFACDCRAVAMTDLVLAGHDEPLVPEGPGICCATLAQTTNDPVESSLPIQLKAGIDTALRAIYGDCPAAVKFPIYLLPPPDTLADELIACVRDSRLQWLIEIGLAQGDSFEAGGIVFLPSCDSAVESVIGLFESTPELPGALVLSFDSPWWRSRLADGKADFEQRHEARRKWLGQPGQGVFAVFVTHRDLPERLAAEVPHDTGYDAMTPYWERRNSLAGGGSFLASLTPSECADLRQALPLARIHRAAKLDLSSRQSYNMAFTREIQRSLERAQIQAALVDFPFDPVLEAGTVPEPAPSDPARACTWLVHNAGDVDCAGSRLAALGVALYGRDIDLDPIAAATNVTVRAGDLGVARGMAMLAMAVARAATGGGHCLCAEFSDEVQLSLYFATVPATVEPAA